MNLHHVALSRAARARVGQPGSPTAGRLPGQVDKARSGSLKRRGTHGHQIFAAPPDRHRLLGAAHMSPAHRSEGRVLR